MSDSNESRLLRLNEGDDVVEPVFDSADLLILLLLSLGMALSSGLETSLLLLLSFGADIDVRISI
jgi:hypothetical protein